MEDTNRVMAWQGARELNVDELSRVAGGTVRTSEMTGNDCSGCGYDVNYD